MFNSREDHLAEVLGRFIRITETPFSRQHKPGKQKNTHKKTNFPGRKVEE